MGLYSQSAARAAHLSAEVKSDSLLGTDITIDDFDGFNDRVLNWNWKFLGWKDTLEINDPGNHYVCYFAPANIVPQIISLSVKKMAVMLLHAERSATSLIPPSSISGPPTHGRRAIN